MAAKKKVGRPTVFRETITECLGLGKGRTKTTSTRFDPAEDQKIVEFLCVDPLADYFRCKGGFSWIVVFLKKHDQISARHTASSLRKRFRYIRANVEKYDISQEWRYILAPPKTVDLHSRDFVRVLPGQMRPLVGRDEERKALLSVLTRLKKRRLGGVTYMYGPPGTGKTLTLNYVLRTFGANGDKNFEFAKLDCLNCEHDQPEEMYEYLRRRLVPVSQTGPTGKAGLEAYISSSDRAFCVLVIDHADRLLSKRGSVLTSLAFWMCHGNACLVVLSTLALDVFQQKASGIAVDTDVCFTPYTAKELLRIGSVMSLPQASPDALQGACHQVASLTGDARLLMHILSKAATLKTLEETIAIENVLEANKLLFGRSPEVWKSQLLPVQKAIVCALDTPESSGDDNRFHTVEEVVDSVVSHWRGVCQPSASSILSNLKTLAASGIVSISGPLNNWIQCKVELMF